MRATQDFNYKVALASGLKSLQAGRLRQAEEQFRYLVEKFPGSPGGYRGLAKVLVELEDRSVRMLFDEHSWAWADNPFIGTKQLAGLKIVNMLLSNWDTKDRRDVAPDHDRGSRRMHPDETAHLPHLADVDDD